MFPQVHKSILDPVQAIKNLVSASRECNIIFKGCRGLGCGVSGVGCGVSGVGLRLLEDRRSALEVNAGNSIARAMQQCSRGRHCENYNYIHN